MFDTKLLKNAKSIKLIVPDTDNIVDNSFVKKLRKKLKLTQKSFAIALGLSVKTVEAWEGDLNHNINPCAKKLLYLLNKHEELIYDLYKIEDNRNPEKEEMINVNTMYTIEFNQPLKKDVLLNYSTNKNFVDEKSKNEFIMFFKEIDKITNYRMSSNFDIDNKEGDYYTYA